MQTYISKRTENFKKETKIWTFGLHEIFTYFTHVKSLNYLGNNKSKIQINWIGLHWNGFTVH